MQTGTREVPMGCANKHFGFGFVLVSDSVCLFSYGFGFGLVRSVVLFWRVEDCF